MGARRIDEEAVFRRFVERVEPSLRRALVASYGPMIGREAAVDALSWAWEHWDRLAPMDNPAGYLYRVGQSAAARHQPKVRHVEFVAAWYDDRDVAPELGPALARLSVQQRTVVVLIHGYAMTQREVAELLGISAATVREHLARALDRLRQALEVHDGQ